MVKVNRALLPVKMHYFFFMAAMGPILPFYPVLGKQLGLSEVALGTITAVFPLLYLVLKPIVGFLTDYFYHWRKLLFLSFLVVTCLSFDILATIHDSVTKVTRDDIYDSCNSSVNGSSEPCHVMCGTSWNLLQVIHKDDGTICLISNTSTLATEKPNFASSNISSSCKLDCPTKEFHLSTNFWIFTVFTSLGSIFFNITNFFSDAICFDVLGEGNDKKYGYQRVWGAIGFGTTALLGGYAIDYASEGLPYQNFLPVFCIATLCIVLDMYFSSKLKLPSIGKSENIVNDVWALVRTPRIAFFLIFATFVGIMDSSIFYFLLWYMEDLAKLRNCGSNIKLLQGLTVAAETLVGETASFFLSGWMLDKIGYALCLSLGFMFYSLRLGLLASISDPWLALLIEAFLQGPSYALLYSTIVAYASSVTPPGTSGTVQGLVAGMDDGLGISVGSLIGGFIYKYYGGRTLYLSYAIAALVCAITHFFIYRIFFKDPRADKTLPEPMKSYKPVCSDVEMMTIETKPPTQSSRKHFFECPPSLKQISEM